MEPNYWSINALAVAVPFICYYLGIIIRKLVVPGVNSPPLSHQLLLGVPVSLVVVSPMLPVLSAAYTGISATFSGASGVLVTLGIIIEHGMLVNESATSRLKEAIGKL